MLFRDDLNTMAAEARSRVFLKDGVPDLIITTDPVHVGYFTAYRSVMLDVDRNYRCAAVITREKMALVVGAADAGPALEVMSDPAAIFRYGNFFFFGSSGELALGDLPKAQPGFMDALGIAVATLLEPGMTSGIDAPSSWERAELLSTLPHATRDAGPQIRETRQVKTESEIARIAQIARLVESGLGKAIKEARAGVTELELSAVIAAEIRAGGGIPRFVVVTAAERAAFADAYATTNPLRNGDLVRFDIGATFDGYWADLARTIVVGTPNHEQQSRYDALLAGEEAQLAAARPGMLASDLFYTAVRAVRSAGLDFYERTHCGHGIGLGAHEFPTLNAANADVVLKEGMVFCVETPYYEIGWGGMMVEDMFVLRTNGPERLTFLPRHLMRAGEEHRS